MTKKKKLNVKAEKKTEKFEAFSGKRESFRFTDKSWFSVLYFALLIIFLIFVVLPAGFRIADNSSKLCDYLGKIWLDETVGPQANPDGIKGCFTYEELFNIGRF